METSNSKPTGKEQDSSHSGSERYFGDKETVNSRGNPASVSGILYSMQLKPWYENKPETPTLDASETPTDIPNANDSIDLYHKKLCKEVNNTRKSSKESGIKLSAANLPMNKQFLLITDL